MTEQITYKLEFYCARDAFIGYSKTEFNELLIICQFFQMFSNKLVKSKTIYEYLETPYNCYFFVLEYKILVAVCIIKWLQDNNCFTLRFNSGVRTFAKALNNDSGNKNIFQFAHCLNLTICILWQAMGNLNGSLTNKKK